jgi:hypothetical protein
VSVKLEEILEHAGEVEAKVRDLGTVKCTEYMTIASDPRGSSGGFLNSL